MTIDDLIKLRRLSSVTLDENGERAIVAAGRVSEDEARFVNDLWLVASNSEPVQLTRGEFNDHSPCFYDGDNIAFLSDRTHPDAAEGVKTTQVWCLPLQGDPYALTHEPAGVVGFRATAKSSRLVVSAPTYEDIDDGHKHHADLQKAGPSALHYKNMPVRHWNQWIGPPNHLYLTDGDRREDLTPTAKMENFESSFSLSPSGRWLLTTQVLWVDRFQNEELLLIDLEDLSRKKVGELSAGYGGLVFHPDEQRVAFSKSTRRDAAPEHQQLILLDLKSGAESELAPNWDRFGTPLGWLNDKDLLVLADDESRRPLFSVGIDGEVKRAAEGSFSAGDSKNGSVALIRSSLQEPPSLSLFNSALEETKAVDLARFEIDDLGANTEMDLHELWSESAGERIQGWVATPKGPGPHPTVLWIHGGPIGQFGDAWHWRWNVAAFVRAGFAVALPNPRGSTGRGDAFMSAIYQDWGGQCYEDLMDYSALLSEQSYVDKNRMAAMGGSFGGYMTNWIGGHPDARVNFRALVTHASLYDMRAFYGATDHPSYFGKMIGGTPWAGGLDRHSPHASVKEWKTPTLIVHGEKDYRVPIGEGLALFEALQANDVESELLVFPDEGHWIQKPRNVRAWYEAIQEFLGRHLSTSP